MESACVVDLINEVRKIGNDVCERLECIHHHAVRHLVRVPEDVRREPELAGLLSARPVSETCCPW